MKYPALYTEQCTVLENIKPLKKVGHYFENYGNKIQLRKLQQKLNGQSFMV